MYYLKTPSWRVGEILTALGEGVDLAASSRIFRHHVHTVVRWQRRGAEHAERLQAHWMSNLCLTHLQLDELVVRVRSQPERVFVWTVIDSLTKILVSIHIGSRKKVDAMQVVHDTKSRLHPDCVPVFTSDGLNHYFYAITAHFGRWVAVAGKRLPAWQVTSNLLYGQLRKLRKHGKVNFATTHMLIGTRAAFRAALEAIGLTGTIQTAFVERLNLTLRESIATLSRRTWSIAHSRESLRWSLEWGRAYYHFVRPHHSLTLRYPSGRIRQRRTPAVAARLTRKIWGVQELLRLPLLPH
jgi:IS1 family transposase